MVAIGPGNATSGGRSSDTALQRDPQNPNRWRWMVRCLLRPPMRVQVLARALARRLCGIHVPIRRLRHMPRDTRVPTRIPTVPSSISHGNEILSNRDHQKYKEMHETSYVRNSPPYNRTETEKSRIPTENCMPWPMLHSILPHSVGIQRRRPITKTWHGEMLTRQRRGLGRH